MESSLQQEFRSLILELEVALDRPSRWNGKVYLARTISFGGAAHYDGSLSLSESVYTDPDLRWRTMIHEALHTFSPSYSRMEFTAARGWEEGVVEEMQRLIRSQLLSSLHIRVNENVLTRAEENHPYNVYILSLEDLRGHLGDQPLNFYRSLLATHLPERALMLRRGSILLNEPERQAFLSAWLKAALVLGR